MLLPLFPRPTYFPLNEQNILLVEALIAMIAAPTADLLAANR